MTNRFFFLVFIIINFNFIKADVTINSDSDAPVLTNFTVSPSYVDVTDGPVDITLSIDVEEASGQLSTTPAIIVSCNGNGGGPSANWSLVSGDVYDGTWNAIITIPETQGDDDFFLSSGNWEDKWGNRANLYPTNDCGSDNGGVTVVNDNAEDDAPVLTNFTVSPSYVDVTDGPVDITLSIDVEEASGQLSTTPAIIVSCNGNGGGPSANWSLVSGDVYDGTWNAIITIPETQGDDDFFLSSGNWEDKWGNRANLYPTNDCGSDNGGVTVVNNHPPNIKSSSFDVDENTTNIGKLKVNDKDGDSLTYAITGTNSISINSNTGKLTFKRAPDFESKSQYTFKAYVNDGTVTTTKRITVNIQDVNEPPSLLATRFTVNQGETRRVRLQATDPESDAVTFQLSPGGDAAYFSLNQSSGVLSFLEKPDFDQRTILNVPILISDGELSVENNVRIIVEKVYMRKLGNSIYGSAQSAFFGSKNSDLFIQLNENGVWGDKKNPGAIFELQYQNGEWTEINAIRQKRNLQEFGRYDVRINKNGTKLFIASCAKGINDDWPYYSQCNREEGSEIHFYKFSDIVNDWVKNGDKLIQTSWPIGVFGRSENFSNRGVNSLGSIIAVKEYLKDGTSGCTSNSFGYPNDSGLIKIQRYKQKNDDSWKKIGKPLRVNNISNGDYVESSYFVLSDDGKKILLGPTRLCDPTLIEDQSISVYEYSDKKWNRVGNKINMNQILRKKDWSELNYPTRININDEFTKISFTVSEKYNTNASTPITRVFYYLENGRWVLQNKLFYQCISGSYESSDTINNDFSIMYLRAPKGGKCAEDNGSMLEGLTQRIYRFEESEWKKVADWNFDGVVQKLSRDGKRVITIDYDNVGAPETSLEIYSLQGLDQ